MIPLKKMVPLALCVAMLASPALAQTPTGTPASAPRKQFEVKDVSLQPGGMMQGVALSTSAKPIAGADVVVCYGTHVIARTKTAADGSFAVKGLRAGAHTVQVGSRSHVFRLWTAAAAPPDAIRTVAVNGDNGVVRGQHMPPVNLPVVAAALTFGVIGGVIGYNIKDDDNNRNRAASS